MVTSPIEPTTEDSRFFGELARLEPSGETDLRILEAAGFAAGRRAGVRQVRRLAMQLVLVAVMIVVTGLVIFVAPRGTPSPGSPGEAPGATPLAGEPDLEPPIIPATAPAAPADETPTTGDEFRGLETELLRLRELAREVPAVRGAERAEAARRIEAALEKIRSLRHDLREETGSPPSGSPHPSFAEP